MAFLTRMLLLTTFATPLLHAQKQEFDVVSIKQNRTVGSQPRSNFPLGPGGMYAATGGVFSASNMPIGIYIMFAYKMTDHEVQSMLKQLPGWAAEDRYDVEAKTDKPNATKDDMRAMMQSLLAERLHLAVHTAAEEVSVLALVLSKPGTLGPRLRMHPAEDTSCSNAVPAPAGSEAAPSPETIAGGFPVICGGLAGLPAKLPGHLAAGYRNVPLSLIALQMSNLAGFDRPVLDQTGITGNVDFAIEFARAFPPDVTPPADYDPSPTFQQALSAQAGLKLIPQKGSVNAFVLDHIDRPSAN